MLKDRFVQEHLSEDEKALKELKVRITLTSYNKVKRFFRGICKNPMEENDSRIYLTQESIEKNLKKYFGHKVEFLN